MNKKIENNMFGKYLEQLLLATGVKNSLIAKELNYDASYICKWTTGKSIPSKKNIEKVIVTVSRILTEHSGEEVRTLLSKHFTIEEMSDLQTVMEQFLRNAYYDTIGELNEYNYINNSSLKVSPKGQIPLLTEFANNLDKRSDLNISVMVDLFALDHVSKLQMAGIKEYYFALKEMREDIRLNYILDITNLDGNSVYDVVLLIHMMTHFSLSNFKLYHNKIAGGKVIIALEDHFAGITLLGDNKQFLCTTSTRDKKTVKEIYENIQNQINPDKKLFLETDMKEMLRSFKYMQSLLTEDNRWLVGHITEHFISPELFMNLSKEYFSEEMQEEIQKTYYLSLNMIKNSQIRVMFYSLSIMDFVLSGELDFFNHKVILSPEQRAKEVVYLKGLFGDMKNGKLKLIKEGFSDEFKYITNPCLFLSETIQYLRLENKQYKNNLLIVKEDCMKKVFDVFFEKIWSEDSDAVISEEAAIFSKMDSYIQASKLFTNTEMDKNE